MDTVKISRSCLAKDSGMGKGQLFDEIFSVLIASFTEASRLVPALGIRQSSIDYCVKKFIIDRAYRFSETELADMLQEPERLFKAFTLFTESNRQSK